MTLCWCALPNLLHALLWADQRRAADAHLLPRDRGPLAAAGCSLQHSPVHERRDLPVEVVAELAQHPNIIGIKDSSGSLERIQSLLAATRSAPKRSVLVTPVFTAVTSRMMMAETEAVAIPDFVSAELLAGVTPVAVAPPVVKTAQARKSGSRSCRVQRKLCFRLWRREPRERFWPLPPARRRPARRSTRPGRKMTRWSRAKSSGG